MDGRQLAAQITLSHLSTDPVVARVPWTGSLALEEGSRYSI